MDSCSLPGRAEANARVEHVLLNVLGSVLKSIRNGVKTHVKTMVKREKAYDENLLSLSIKRTRDENV